MVLAVHMYLASRQLSAVSYGFASIRKAGSVTGLGPHERLTRV